MKSTQKRVATSHKKRIFTMLIAVFLLAVTVISTPLAISVKADGQIQEQKLYDYSHSGSPINKTIDTVGLVEFYLASVEEQMTNAEREFIESFGRITLTYCDVITTDKIRFSYNDITETLTVTPEKYSYKAKDGSLTWVPVTVTVKGSEKALVNGSAEFSLDKDSYSAAEIEVVYNASAPLAASEINEIINLYHDTAKYSFEVEEYDKKLALYEAYLHAKRLYDDALIEYNEYLVDYEKYNSSLKLYEAYIQAMNEYAINHKSYLNYLSDVEKYEEALLLYNKYLSTMETVKDHLLALEITKTPMTDQRSLFASVMGRTVDEVLENKTLLTGSTIGASKEVIDLAGDATARVRAHLNNYFACTTVSEKYNYYVLNYEKICSAFRDLTITLDELYQNRKVRGVLISEGKDKKYIILVAQLALVTTSLIDGEVLDYDGNSAYGPTWTIEKKTINTILENKTYITDTNSRTPLEGGAPAEVIEPVEPQAVAEPTLPEKVQQPIKPDEVMNPGEPPEVHTNPTVPTPMTESAGVIYSSVSAQEKEDLAASYELGELKSRRSGSDFVIPLITTVKKQIGVDDAIVEFVSERGDALYSVSVSSGSAVVFEGDIPFKEEDDYYSYKFIGWKNEQGNLVNLSSIDGSVKLYPMFRNMPKYYDVTWCVDGKTVTENLPADTIPVCPLPLEKGDTGSYMFTFAGWDKPIELVGRDITYVAEYNRLSIFSVGSKHVEIIDDGRNLICTAPYAFETEFSVKELLLRAAGRRGIIINVAAVSLEISYAQVTEMQKAGAEIIEVNALQRGSGSYNYSVAFIDGRGDRICEPITCVMTLPCSFVTDGYATLFTYEGDEKKYVKFSGEKNIRFSASSDKTYIAALEYGITATSTASATVSCDKSTAVPGERVRVNVDLPKGMELSRFIITASNGEEIKLDTDSTFVMPMGDVTVGAVSKVKMYTVTFIAAGKTIASHRLAHGEAITPPAAPKLENDGKYSYEFVSWNAEIGTAVGNAEYIAIYRSQLLPEKPKEPAIVVSASVMRLIVTAFTVAAIFLFAVIPSTVMGIVLIRKHKRVKISSKSKEQKSL